MQARRHLRKLGIDRFLLQLVPYHQKPYLQLFFGCGFRLLFTHYNDYNMTSLLS